MPELDPDSEFIKISVLRPFARVLFRHMKHRPFEQNDSSAPERGPETGNMSETCDDRLRQLLDAVEDYGLFMLDLEGRVQEWSRGAERITQYRASEITGKPISLLHPRELKEKDHLSEELRDTARTGRHEEEGWRIRKDGSRYWASKIITPVRDENGGITGYAAVIRDLTGRHRREDEMRTIVESAPNGLIVVDGDGVIELVNPQALHAFGYVTDELIGKPIDMLVPDRFRGHHDHLRRGYVARPQKRPMGAGRDLYGLRKDGTEFPVEIALTPLGGEGKPGILATVVDITERKMAEEALRASEERTRTLLESAPQIMWVLDERGSARYFNGQWSAFTGLAGDPNAQHVEDAVHPDDRDAFLALRREHIDAGTEFGLELRLRRNDGEYIWHTFHVVPMEHDGAVTSWLGTAIDINERKLATERMAFLARASNALGSSLDYEQTLRHVASLAVPEFADWCAVSVFGKNDELEPVAVEHWDPEKTARAWEIARSYPPDPENPAGALKVALSGEPILMPSITDEMIAASARDDKHFEMLKSTGFRSAIIVPLPGRDKPLGALTMIWSDTVREYEETDLRFAMDLAGRAGTAIENARSYRIARDAESRLSALNETLEAKVRARTERLHQTARDLERANENLERRNRELQDFAYVASHDLQEPLRKITTFANLLIVTAEDRLGDEDLFYVERMQNAAERMSTLINDLLLFSRVQTQGHSFKRIDLARVVTRVLDSLEISMSETGAVIECGELCTIEADPTQMHQLLQNLISNALKFRHPDITPVIQIRSRMETEPATGARRPRPVCVLEVQDNGIGFDPKYAARAFAPFQRLHQRDTYPGTGMGLAIVRRIVERHHGDVTVRTAPGRGTTFVVTLPLVQE
jgi:PAS domain S-box-containing protein